MEINTIRKEFRKFQKLQFYDDLESNSFSLLPFNFKRLNSGRQLLISMVGDYLIVPNGTVEDLLKKNIDNIDESLYYDLLSNHIVSDSQNVKSLELLANRYRQKKLMPLILHSFIFLLSHYAVSILVNTVRFQEFHRTRRNLTSHT